MEDNKAIVLALLILIISSFNVGSITGKASVSESIGKNTQASASGTSLLWYLNDNKGDIDRDGIAFTYDDFKAFNLKFNQLQLLKNMERGYDPAENEPEIFRAADVFPAPSYYGDSIGDGSWTNRDLELFRQLVVKTRDRSQSNTYNFGRTSLIPECRDGQVSLAPRGYRKCSDGMWLDYICPDGYDAVPTAPNSRGMQEARCIKSYLRQESHLKQGEDLYVLRE